MKKKAWYFLATVIILTVVLNLLVRCEGGGDGEDSQKKVSYQKPLEYPRAYWETRKPDTVTTFITVEPGKWSTPVHAPPRVWGWVEFSYEAVSDRRVYYRLAVAEEILQKADVHSTELNTNKDPIPGSYRSFHIQFMIPPDTKLRGELPKIAFKTRKMQ